VTLAVEHYNRMVRLLDRDVPVRMEIDIGVRFTEESQASNFNIVGEIPGTDKRDELVVIGAHFDSWHGATGATDNAAGVAAMMEVLRIFKTVGLAPRRTIRIGLWGNEEGGFVGSASYAATYLGTRDAPKPEHAKTSVYFNLDNGTGPIRGIWTQGNANARAVFETWTRPVADLGVNLVSPRPVGQTDHVSFDRVGVPGFQFVQERYEYNSRTHHSNMDVYDRLQAEDLRQVATVAAVYVWQAANADSLVPRLTEAP
jgi:Zn-dependent M28 family amino/carboxypeptidase